MTTKVLKPDASPGGPISWMARNRVAANLVMFTFLIGGVIMMFRVKQEVFPDFDVDRISVSVPYPGASPEEVEQGILLAIEDEVRGIEGVKEVRSNALEGTGAVSIEIQSGAEPNEVLQDVMNAVDRIQSFPEEAERPIVRLVQVRRQVVSIIVYGQLEHGDLRDVAERVRDDLLNRGDERPKPKGPIDLMRHTADRLLNPTEPITLIELGATRPREIAVEVPQETLRSLGLTLEQVAAVVRRTAIELPGGEVRTEGGQVLLRTTERRDFAREFADIEVVSQADGTRVTLGRIADIRDTFAETDDEASFIADNVMGGESMPAVRVDIFRVGDQTPIGIVNTVNRYLDNVRAELPEGVHLALWDDSSAIYRDRINLLLRNAAIGLGLVLLLLGLFLEPRLAFWVMLGLPISIIGSFLLIPVTGATINMISLFAFIVTLGIIVDDAIMVGENIYEHRERGMPFREAAIEGARQIAGPVHFAVLTNMAAFMPLFFVPGAAGNLFLQIPAVVVTVFAISLIESLYVLPAHLSHRPGKHVVWTVLGWPSRFFGKGLHFVSHRVYPAVARFCVSNRYATFAAALAMMVVSIGAVLGGHVPWSWFPRVDADLVRVEATLPFGSPIERSGRVAATLEKGARETLRRHGGEAVVKGVYVRIGGTGEAGGPGAEAGGLPGASGAHNVSVQVSLASADQRDISGVQFARQWRRHTPTIAGLEALVYTGTLQAGAEEAINLELTHRSRDTLEAAAQELAGSLQNYAGVTDIDDGVELGKPQLSFTINPEARSLGLTSTDVARQVRSAFYGAEALRQQRGRDEVKVMVRLPETDRRRMQTVEDLILRTPGGGEIPLREAVETRRGRSYTVIRRREGRRVLSVTADVDETVANANEVVQAVTENDLPALRAKHPGLSYSLEGQQRQQRESMSSLAVGFALALIGIYAMLAIPFKHYFQPIIIMLAIPFGIIGAVLGHYALGYEISMISFFGIIALAGVVVNDSLVLVVTVNRLREQEGMEAKEAVIAAGSRRFRPILLTSVTTFGGLAPMIFETSMQARFLIPMAIALGFGILFSTLIILLLVPAVYMILEDVIAGLRLIFVAPPEELGLAAEPAGRAEEQPAPLDDESQAAPQT